MRTYIGCCNASKEHPDLFSVVPFKRPGMNKFHSDYFDYSLFGGALSFDKTIAEIVLSNNSKGITSRQYIYWKLIIYCYSSALLDEGFKLVNEEPLTKILLPDCVRARIGGKVVKAKFSLIRHMPRDYHIECLILEAAERGHAGSWADWLRMCLADVGWEVHPKPHDDYD